MKSKRPNTNRYTRIKVAAYAQRPRSTIFQILSLDSKSIVSITPVSKRSNESRMTIQYSIITYLHQMLRSLVILSKT
ncbi:unnamed protein product [Rhizophagus irregularis]|uniref:Uncharacterized protein n=1 Tax=Rhizophagus irregularis TaxID=588596 RepID=A0A916EAS5_9GLOM|nr:unnamed protein product [Rhizophagus irregularis]CAB4487978.1 unnamed protein product [Rhizophagus irregularis]CAB5211872.1 unnamed protein product [Rhizophagus irregularis]CAB5360129.1 unnamed protein product [Rhizophagus irregularis]CAB5376086.1 unnamed protein product [Rhizophagus irregularis]